MASFSASTGPLQLVDGFMTADKPAQKLIWEKMEKRMVFVMTNGQMRSLHFPLWTV